MPERRIAGTARRRAVHACIFSAVVVAAALTSACLGAQAKTVAVAQPLQIPEPPPRVVEVSNPELPPPVPLPEEPVRTPPSAVLTTPTRASDTPRPAEPPKADVPVDAGKPAEDPKPPTTLQTTPTQQEGEQERRIRVRLTQAGTSLNRINYQALNTDGRMHTTREAPHQSGRRGGSREKSRLCEQPRRQGRRACGRAVGTVGDLQFRVENSELAASRAPSPSPEPRANPPTPTSNLREETLL